jgi:hypothetical protein
MIVFHISCPPLLSWQVSFIKSPSFIFSTAVLAEDLPTQRDVLIFQWRLNPGFKVDLDNVLSYLPSFNMPRPSFPLIIPAPALTSNPPQRSANNKRKINGRSDVITIKIKDGTEEIPCRVSLDTRVSTVIKEVCCVMNVNERDYKIFFDMDLIRYSFETIQGVKMEDGDTIDAFQVQVGD